MVQWLPMGSQQEWRPSWHTPIAASFLQEVVHHTPRIQEQTTRSERMELAHYLGWQDAKRFFSVWPTDYKEAMRVLSSVGLSEGPDNTLHISKGWEQKPLPWEFMD